MNEELLYNQLYDKTKDCGRTQFVKLLMEKERENKELKDEIYKSNAVAETNKELAKSYYKDNQKLKEQLQQKEDIINKAKEYVKDYKTEWTLNDEVLDDMDELLEILDNKGE